MIILKQTILNYSTRRYLLLLLSFACLYATDGCTDPYACNYNSAVAIDDGSCEYLTCSADCPFSNEGIYSDCSYGASGCDCNDRCGGSATLDECSNCVGGSTTLSINHFKDECGVCGDGTTGPGAEVLCCDASYQCNIEDCPFCPEDCPAGTVGMVNYLGSDNLCVPTEFSFAVLSNQQAFYWFISAKVNGITLDSNDWIGAFNGDVCVGAKNWNGPNTDIPVMGYSDLSSGTDGYCNPGDIPTFKIYDSSDNVYIDAKPSEDVPWIAEIINIDNLTFISGCTVIAACNYNPDVTEPDDSSCEYVADCTGACGGSAVEDECGTCDSNSANDCGQDCAGTWGGSAYNQGCGCGVYDKLPTDGCDNACGSTLEHDECGVCGGSGIPDDACDCAGNVVDCAGLCGGSAVEDDNGICIELSLNEVLRLDEFHLHNIYPNPFNPTTSIDYILANNTAIELIIYNIHGRKIQTLVSAFQTAGYHSINWNASNYPNGVYLIRLKSGKYIETQKVVLIK